MNRREDDPYKDWVKFRVRNYGTETLINNLDLSQISRMLIDGVDTTPVNYYNFGDTDYHDVFVLVIDYDVPLNSIANVLWKNYILRYADFPAKLIHFGVSVLRNMGAAQRSDVALRAEILPSFNTPNYNFYGQTLTHFYVPSDLMSNYQSISNIPASRIHPLEEFPHSW